jgi:mannosyltransferase OCH1-like enzyme
MIHQIFINSTNTLPELPEYIQFCQYQIQNLYPNFKYHLYSGKEIEGILQNNFPKDIITSYHSLKPYAYRADLDGGLYIDLSLLCLSSLTLEDTNFFAFRDLPEFSDPWWAINNAIIYSKPKSNIMKTAIDLIVNHCKTKFYGVSAIDVGGPTLLGKAVMRSQENFHKVFTNGQVNHIESKDLNIEGETLNFFGYDLNKLTGFVLDQDKKIIALRKPSKGGDIQSLGLEGTNNYVNMWSNKSVYDNSVKFTADYYYEYK